MISTFNAVGVNLAIDGLVAFVGAGFIGSRIGHLCVRGPSQAAATALSRTLALAGLFRMLGAIATLAGIVLLV